MKKYLFSLLLLISMNISAQNVFPTNGDVGIGTLNPAATLDVEGRTTKFSNFHPTYRMNFGGDQDLNWKTIAVVTLDTGQWTGVEFKVNMLDVNTNYGGDVNSIPMLFYVRMTRSGGNPNDANDAAVSGPVADYVRVVKTSTGFYELQVRQIYNWRSMEVSAEVISYGEFATVTYMNSLASGSTTGVIYMPLALHRDYFTNAYISGNLGIGTTTPTEKLSVNGNIRAKKLIVTQSGWSDYVFDSSYHLSALSQVEQFIKANKHLPSVPSAKQIEKDGIDVGDNQAVLLKKIEELTLYMIEQNKKIEEIEKQNQQMKKEVRALQKIN